MQSIWKLASQYDLLGIILLYTTRAKVIMQQLWLNNQDWDDPQLPGELRQAWTNWEEELKFLLQVTVPSCYNPSHMDQSDVYQKIHVFSDASENAYGAVAYLHLEGNQGILNLAFLLARSKVAPRKHQSILWLELCATLVGAQLVKCSQLSSL